MICLMNGIVPLRFKHMSPTQMTAMTGMGMIGLIIICPIPFYFLNNLAKSVIAANPIRTLINAFLGRS